MEIKDKRFYDQMDITEQGKYTKDINDTTVITQTGQVNPGEALVVKVSDGEFEVVKR